METVPEEREAERGEKTERQYYGRQTTVIPG